MALGQQLKLALFFIFLFSLGSLKAQNGAQLFDTDSLHEIRFTFAQNNFWQTLSNNYISAIDVNTGVPTNVPYLMGSVEIDGELIDSVGLRQKGFSSHFASNEFKKSLKIDFNEFVRGKNFDGIKKVNLANGVGDPSMMRDAICYDMMREAGIRAPRTAHAKVYINDEYWGLYVLVEQVDKTFIEQNFADSSGDLFKNIAWSELEYQGANPETYKSTIALRTNEDEDNWEDYIEFVQFLNQSNIEDFENEIEKYFNVEYYLRVLAIDVMTNNWDSYIEHGRNFYLYHEPSSGQFFWIPWDYNFAMGGSFENEPPSFGEPPEDPSQCPTFVDPINGFEKGDSIFAEVVAVEPFCCYVSWEPFCQDIYNHLSTIDQCGSILDGSSPYPADDPVFQQVTFFQPECCSGPWNEECQYFYDLISEDEAGGPGLIRFPLDMGDSEKVLISKILSIPHYRQKYFDYACHIIENNFTQERIGAIVDKASALIYEAKETEPNPIFPFEDFLYDISEGVDTTERFIPSVKQFMEIREEQIISDLDRLGQDCSASLSSINWNDIVINEFVAANDSTSNIFDQDGEADDWIELYNNTDELVDLTDYFLSDKYDNPLKWAFPAGTQIGPNDFLIVWADENGMEEGLHANFKLSKGGESLMIVHSDGTFIDSLSFGAQETNIPYARIPNGTGDFQFHYATFNRSNDGPSATKELVNLNLKVYPNPVSQTLNVEFDNLKSSEDWHLRLSTMFGEGLYVPINKTGNKAMLDVGQIEPGMYILTANRNNAQVSYKIMVN